MPSARLGADVRRRPGGRKLTTHCNGPAERNGPCKFERGSATRRPLMLSVMRKQRTPTPCDICGSPATHYRSSPGEQDVHVCDDHAAQAGFKPPERRFWPWPLLKPEADWNDFDRDLIEFMQIAYSEGFRPCDGPCIEAEAWADSGRSIALVRRGARNGWEPLMIDGSKPVRLGPIYDLPLGEGACVCIRPPFRSAAHFALQWLRGRALPSLLSEFDFVGGRPSGIVLRTSAMPLPSPANSDFA